MGKQRHSQWLPKQTVTKRTFNKKYNKNNELVYTVSLYHQTLANLPHELSIQATLCT